MICDPGSSTILFDHHLYTMVKTKGFSLDSCGCSLVNEVKRNLFGSSFDVSDSGLIFKDECSFSKDSSRKSSKTNSQVPRNVMDHG
ncbi:hypothetical protein HA466_0218610 [Hirschfeldia incana]|nr:hypothetical protein HA466_0218610 [Hirschfeldia incana]